MLGFCNGAEPFADAKALLVGTDHSDIDAVGRDSFLLPAVRKLDGECASCHGSIRCGFKRAKDYRLYTVDEIEDEVFAAVDNHQLFKFLHVGMIRVKIMFLSKNLKS